MFLRGQIQCHNCHLKAIPPELGFGCLSCSNSTLGSMQTHSRVKSSKDVLEWKVLGNPDYQTWVIKSSWSQNSWEVSKSSCQCSPAALSSNPVVLRTCWHFCQLWTSPEISAPTLLLPGVWATGQEGVSQSLASHLADDILCGDQLHPKIRNKSRCVDGCFPWAKHPISLQRSTADSQCRESASKVTKLPQSLPCLSSVAQVGMAWLGAEVLPWPFPETLSWSL